MIGLEPVLPKARFLDPREMVEAVSQPIWEAASIPFADLRDRVFELPPPHEPVVVADVGETSLRALEVLESLKRTVIVSDDFEYCPAKFSWRLWEPNPLLVPCPEPIGTYLDLGCGAGREAVWMAAHGWQVKAVDRLPDALALGRRLQATYAPESSIEWVGVVLGAGFENGKQVDAVGAFFFHDWAVLSQAADLLKLGGRLFTEAFTPTHRETFAKPSERSTATLAELVRWGAQTGLDVQGEEGWLRGRHTVRAVLTRSS